MFTTELAVLLTLAGSAALLTLIQAARTALPQVAALRQALAACPAERELRYTITTTVVHYHDGNVVRLNPRREPSPLPQPARAAA